MKKILIISDEHGKTSITNKLLKNNKYDLKIHLGDSLEDINWLQNNFDKFVQGNNDSFVIDKWYEEFEYEGIKFNIFHGTGLVSMNPEYQKIIKSFDKEYDVYLFGHNHLKSDITIENKRFINPGSVGLPRDGKLGSYIEMEIDKGKISKLEYINI